MSETSVVVELIASLAMIITGVLAMAFMGFAGMVTIQ